MRGGQYLFLDEVHKYPNWAQELKNAYDDHPSLKMVFTGSSALEILNARADLSRRAVLYNMQGFSFREYLSLETGMDFKVLRLNDLLQNHFNLAFDITAKLRPLQYFDAYLKNGYYPFYREGLGTYHQRLSEVINMILEIELPQLRGVEPGYVHKVKQLLSIIAESVPFIPNITKLSEKIQLNRATLLAYLHYLDEIRLTNNVYRNASGISLLQKPSKVLLENTNLVFNLAPSQANKGNLRETFFSNQVGFVHTLQYAAEGDFMVDQQYVFEIGGKHKGSKQIDGIAEAYVVADDIETGLGNRIPLWLFGFLY
jgi:predicted AAA+ superfamily ATPase